MAKVRIRIDPLLAGIPDTPGDWVILEEQIGQGASIGTILEQLAAAHGNLRRAIFEPDGGGLSNQVLFVLNEQLLQVRDATAVKLKDGDTLTILTIDAGG